MGLFKRKPKFIAAVCPQCGGNLEMDAQLQTAYCTKCGAHCLVEDVQIRKPKKETPLQTVVGFVERQADLNRKDRAARRQEQAAEKKRREEEKKLHEEEDKKQTNKALIIGCILLVVIMIFALALATLE